MGKGSLADPLVISLAPLFCSGLGPKKHEAVRRA